MRKHRRWLLPAGIVLAGVLAFVFAAGLYYYFVVAPRTLEQKRAAVGAPTIIVYSPRQGDSAPEGAMLSTSAAATGRNPIARLELWWDGQLYEQRTPDPGLRDTLTTFDAEASVEITGGTHLLYWRAIDNDGLIGQSPSIAITGTPRLGGGGIEVVRAKEGQSLQDIAESLGGEPDVLGELNPGLGEGGLPGGTAVKVPQSGGDAGQQPPPGYGPNAGEPPGGGGGQQPLPGNAPSPPPPEPGEGAYAVNAVAIPVIDIRELIPMFLSAMPVAPSHLEAGFEPCVVRLVWNDNADNEDRFEIWMQTLGGPPIRIKTTSPRPGTGTTWFEFKSPSFGIYSFWVEAANSLGSQPSDIVWVAVNDATCGEGVASKLEIEVLRMRVVGDFGNQVYCYLSVEGWPEKRVPEDDNEFLHEDAQGFLNIYDWLGTRQRILVNMPADEEVTLEGDCWAYLDGNAQRLGPDPFGVSVPKEHWDNRTLQILTTNYAIDFRIRPLGSTEAQGAFRYLDSDLFVPTIVSVEAMTSRDPSERARVARNVTVTWMWNPPQPQEITNFVIAMDGAMEFRWANQSDRTHSIVLPSTCGGSYKFAVAAVGAGGARSAYSPWYEYVQPPCDVYAQVDFLTFELTSHADGEAGSCDTAELILRATVSSANRVYREWQGEGAASDGYAFPYGTSTSCHQDYHFSQYPLFAARSSPGKEDTFTVLIEPSTSTVGMYVEFQDMDTFIVPWDYDGICSYSKDIHVPYDQWIGYDQAFSETCQDPVGGERDGTVQLNYRVRGYRTPRGP